MSNHSTKRKPFKFSIGQRVEMTWGDFTGMTAIVKMRRHAGNANFYILRIVGLVLDYMPIFQEEHMKRLAQW